MCITREVDFSCRFGERMGVCALQECVVRGRGPGKQRRGRSVGCMSEHMVWNRKGAYSFGSAVVIFFKRYLCPCGAISLPPSPHLPPCLKDRSVSSHPLSCPNRVTVVPYSYLPVVAVFCLRTGFGPQFDRSFATNRQKLGVRRGGRRRERARGERCRLRQRGSRRR